MSERNRETKLVKFWTPLRVVSTVIVLALLAAFGASSCNSNDPTPSSNQPSAARRPPSSVPAAPLTSLPPLVLDTELKSAKGEPLKLANYSGKVMVVNLWATWCGPCRRETPELVKLQQEYKDRGVQMIGLSTEDPTASAQSVQEFVRRYNVDYPVGWATRDIALTLMQGDGRIPQSFVITRDGRIKKRFTGFHPVNTPPELKQAIEAALTDNG